MDLVVLIWAWGNTMGFGIVSESVRLRRIDGPYNWPSGNSRPSGAAVNALGWIPVAFPACLFCFPGVGLGTEADGGHSRGQSGALWRF